MLVKQRAWLVVLLQLCLVVSSLTLAWLLRFEFAFPQAALMLGALPPLIALRLAAMARFNLFHGYWRYAGMSDALDIFKAVATGSAAFFLVERGLLGQKAFPLSIYFLEAILTTVLLGGIRILSRAAMQRLQQHGAIQAEKSVVVVGAGCGAAMLLRELPRSGYKAVALVDDDHAKAHATLHGVRVAGTVAQLPAVVRRYQPQEIMIAIPSATGQQMRRIAEYCHATGVPFRTIPGLRDLIHGNISVDQLREVNLEDLLGRTPVRFDLEAVKRRIAGRVVMVTGAAGSIGSELCRQLLRYAPAKLVCVDQAETPLFYLQQEHTHAAVEQAYCVADVTDSVRMRALIKEHRVNAIFHAAAYKHVPLMEENLQEAVKNNVFGLLSLLEVADRGGCEDFLLISSDKAVNPTSFMGCTKRLGELMLAAWPSPRMRCLSVRFGNVLGSQGSVVPLFQEQIRNHRQITVTHRDVTRYFMTIPEAVSLVLQAFVIGERSDILVLDMGEPVRILDMAKSLIRLSGIPEGDVRIVFSGLRPGEKLFEELFYEFEQPMDTAARKVLRTRTQSPLMVWPELRFHLESLRAGVASGEEGRIRAKVKQIVPQYAWAPQKRYSEVAALGLRLMPEPHPMNPAAGAKSPTAPTKGPIPQEVGEIVAQAPLPGLHPAMPSAD
jgi:FlaA1/EpsC-like NDP-sugar epimerase